MSPYALVFPKAGLFSLGASPVIYGLDDRGAHLPKGSDGGARVMDEELLPLREQYRYVAFNPAANGKLDWSHEREWRWPYRGSLEKFEQEIEDMGLVDEPTDIPGFDITTSSCRGMGVVVKTDEEARWVASDILTLVDRGVIDQQHYDFVMSAEALPDPENIRDPGAVSHAIESAMIDLRPFFSLREEAVQGFSSRFTELVGEVASIAPERPVLERGGVWLWILDNTHDLTRSLLKTGRVSVSKVGRYLAELPEFGSRRDLREREQMATKLARLVSREFGLECGYFSVKDSTDYDEVPFYNGDHLDHRMFYNVSWE